jgi:hypothetical protein
MAYSKTNWVSGGAPGISADNLNNLETQYDEAIITSAGQVNTHDALASAHGGRLVPSGLIVMWHGLLANIPSGWVLCDGNNSTPNLLDKFIVSVPNGATNPGTTGGSLSKTTAGHTHGTPLAYDSTNNALTLATSPTLGADIAVTKRFVRTTDSADSKPQLITDSKTDSIADIRPPCYTVAFLMKS